MKKWTIMVYMCGDNNLSVDMAYALQDIREVAKITKGDINLLAYYDTNSPDVPTYYFDFSDYENPVQKLAVEIPDKLYPLNKGNRKRKKSKQPMNEVSSYAYSLLNFVDWCVNRVECKDEDGKDISGRRAENYALIFSGHSFGFQDIGLFKDETSGYTMTHNKLRWVFRELTKTKDKLEAGEQLILGQKLGILGFDSCVMSMLEVGYQFQKYADTMIASEGSVPNAGWIYGKVLGNICRKQEAVNVHQTAKRFVRDFIEGESQFAMGGVSVDMAAWDCTKIPDVATAFGKLVTVLQSCFEEEYSAICRQMRRILLQVHWNCQSYMYEQNVDLMDFARLLSDEVKSLEEEFGHDFDGLTGKIKDACSKLIGKLEECILQSGFCGGQYQYSNGMSIFFPWTLPSYQVSQKCYENLAFCNKNSPGRHWNQFLQFYLNVVTIRPPQEITKEATTGLNALRLSNSNGIPNTLRVFPAVRIPQNTINKGLDILNEGNGHSIEEIKIPQNTYNKLPWKPDAKIPQNTANKLAEEFARRIPQNTVNRIPQNTVNRIPQNTVNRMFGGTDSFFHYFMSLKNVVTPWNLYGFTKAFEEEEYRKTDEILAVIEDEAT
jgi:hypothetical protein